MGVCRVSACIHAQIWDLGGQASLRPSWASYYQSTDAVIVVLDSTDRARVRIAKVSMDAPNCWQWFNL